MGKRDVFSVSFHEESARKRPKKPLSGESSSGSGESSSGKRNKLTVPDARNQRLRRRDIKQVKVAETPGPKGTVGVCRAINRADVVSDPPGVKQAATGYLQLSPWNWGTLTPLYLERGRENASVWESGQRRHRSPMPFCNGKDMVKARQGKTLDDSNNGRTRECRWRRRGVASCSPA